jgi:uncharacterized membrane protein YphA (DoxX/SURF4 family)
MSTVTANYAAHSQAAAVHPAQRAASILRWTYGLVPIVAGADKFFHILTDWNKYLAPAIADIIPAGTFMSIVGIIEIVAGILVLAKPRIGSLVVALWLLGIAINLVLTGQYFDVAVRDTVMAIGAYCLHLLWNDKREAGSYS